jgi:DNA-binding NarL/FixJ family response regulator
VVTEPEHTSYHLTKREYEVLSLMVDGLNNREIADRLAISQHTAKNHVSSLLAKLGASSRTEAAIIAMDLNLIKKHGSHASPA